MSSRSGYREKVRIRRELTVRAVIVAGGEGGETCERGMGAERKNQGSEQQVRTQRAQGGKNSWGTHCKGGNCCVARGGARGERCGETCTGQERRNFAHPHAFIMLW